MVIIKKHEEDELNSAFKAIPNYYDVQLRKHEEKELERDTKLKDIFLGSLEYYKKNYPNSKKHLKWEQVKETLKFDKDKLLKENIEGFNEKELNLGWLVVQYSIKEKNYHNIELLRNYEEIHDKFIKLIPGGRYLKEEYRLKDNKDFIERRQKEIADIREEERKVLENRLSKDTPKEAKFVCEWCLRDDFKNKGGLGSHKRSCSKNPEKV